MKTLLVPLSFALYATSVFAAPPHPEFTKAIKEFDTARLLPNIDELNQNGDVLRKTALCETRSYDGTRGHQDLIVFKTLSGESRVAVGAGQWVLRMKPEGSRPAPISSSWDPFNSPTVIEGIQLEKTSIAADNERGVYGDVGSKIELQFKKTNDAVYVKAIRTDLQVPISVSKCKILPKKRTCFVSFEHQGWVARDNLGYHLAQHVTYIDTIRSANESDLNAEHFFDVHGVSTVMNYYNWNLSWAVRMPSDEKAKEFFVDRCLSSSLALPWHDRKLSQQQCLDVVAQTFQCQSPE